MFWKFSQYREKVVRSFIYGSFNKMKENGWRFCDFPKNSEVCRRFPKVPEKEPKMFWSYVVYLRDQGPESRVQSPVLVFHYA